MIIDAILNMFSPFTILLMVGGLVIIIIPLRLWKMKHVVMASVFTIVFFTSGIYDILSNEKVAGFIKEVMQLSN